ncbi:MAG: nickel pincer cofactor biosynthesis protein LarB [Janthinobacterium lividum]
MAEFKLDLARHERIGLDEAIFCAGKTADQIGAILDAYSAGGGLLLTRLDAGKFEALPARLRSLLDYEPLSCTAILGASRPARGGAPVAVVMAGTSDLPMGREACRTLAFNGQPHGAFTDIGVAGLWRLLDRIEEIRRAPVVIVAAGMDAALVSVVGGLVRAPVVALPTSVGYGVAEGGTPALHSALASCAPGVTVVNIDNGYGAACAALRICNLLAGRDSGASTAAPDAAHAVSP